MITWCVVGTSSRTSVLREQYAIDALRCGLTVVLFPEQRTLAADDEDSQTSDRTSSCGSSSAVDDHSAAAKPLLYRQWLQAYQRHAYDPLMLLPFAIQCLRDQAMEPAAFVSCGLLAVCLRALAAEDYELR